MRHAISHLRNMMRRRFQTACLAVAAFTAGCSGLTGPDERVTTLEVAESRAPCVGLYKQQCLQVRERADAPYSLFYDAIEGFTYVPGSHYVLLVGIRAVVSPMADGPSLSYRLIRVISVA